MWTVNLYLGRDEEIVTLLDGEPAPAHTPITVRQMVLSMDEETTIAAEDGGIDFRDLDAFDQWVTDPVHLQQVLPEQRGVVVLVPRRTGRDYGDPMVTATLNERNRRSYWLIRNGGRLFRMSTDFPVGDRLTPTREEFDTFFVERRHNHTTGHTEQIRIEPGSPAWLRAEEAADDRRRHFMRAALILQGLIDRTTVFRPLPADHVSLLEPASYDAGHVRLITDAENTLSPGRQPFHEWLAERNAGLRPGMRIIGAFHGEEFRSLRSREGRWSDEHDRLYPPRAEGPLSSEMYSIEGAKPGGGLVIRYARTERVWTRDNYGNGEYRAPKTRASCTLYPRDTFILPIDLVTIEEMTGYLTSRVERHAYRDMLPLLGAAIAAKQAEADAEAPFRTLLATQIATEHGLELDDATVRVEDLVRWWKLTNVWHRPLVAHPEAEAKAIREIVTEAGARLSAEADRDTDAETRMVARLRERIPDAMLIARTRDGGYVALAPQPRRHPAPIARPQVYTRRYTTGKTGKTITERQWSTFTPAQVARWHLIWTSQTWNTWDLTAAGAATLSDPEIDTLIDHIHTAADHHQTSHWDAGTRVTEPTGTLTTITYEPATGTGKGTLLAYFDTGTDVTKPERPLTTRTPEVCMRRVEVSWHRSTGGTLTHDVATDSCQTPWDTSRHFTDDTSPDLRPPWRDQLVLWTDPDRLTRLRHQAEKVRRIEEEARDLHKLASGALAHLAIAWETRTEHTAYLRFLADYQDPDLWEGHRKTLRDLRFPHRGHRDLRRLLNRLVEDGHDLAGHTVATATDILHGETFTLPDDVLDLSLAEPHPRTDNQKERDRP